MSLRTRLPRSLADLIRAGCLPALTFLLLVVSLGCATDEESSRSADSDSPAKSESNEPARPATAGRPAAESTADGRNGLVLFAAGDSLWSFDVPLEFSEGSESYPEERFVGSWTSKDVAPPVLNENPVEPLVGLATEALPLRNLPSTVAIATELGLYLVRLLPSADGGGTFLELALEGTNIDGIEESFDGRIYLLEHPDEVGGEVRDPHSILLYDPASGARPSHVADCSPAAYDLFLPPGDEILWITHLNGRTLDRVDLHASPRQAEPVRIEQGPEKRDDPFWLLRLAFPNASRGMLLFEQGRGTQPRLLRLRPDGQPIEHKQWENGFHVRNATIDPNGELLVLNAVSDLITHYVPTGDETTIRAPHHVRSVALSPDGRLLAFAMEFERNRSRIEILKVGTKETYRTRDIGGIIPTLAFAARP